MEALPSRHFLANKLFTSNLDLKDELASTAIQITCYDRDGKEVKRVTSTDPGTVEDPENENQNGSQNQNHDSAYRIDCFGDTDGTGRH